MACCDLGTADHCLMHGRKNRSNFQHFLNATMDVLFPSGIINRVGKVVCSCKGENNTKSNQPLDGAEMEDLRLMTDSFSPGMESESEKENSSELKAWVPALRKLLQGSPHPNMRSRYALLCVVQAAQKKDYSMLLPENAASAPVLERWHTEQMDLPITFNQVGLLVGKKGHRLQEIEKKFNCQISVQPGKMKMRDFKTIMAYLTGSKSPSAVLKTKEKNTIQSAKAHLLETAQAVKKKHDLHVQRMQLYYKRKSEEMLKRRRTNIVHHSAGRGYKRGVDYKEAVTRTFEGKSKHSNSGNTTRAGTVTKVLDEGARCVQCLTPYAKELTKANACKYHDKYPINGQWQCCEESLQGTVDTEMLRKCHAETGCCQGNHVWKLTKNKSDHHTSVPRKMHGDPFDMNSVKKSIASCKGSASQILQDLD